MKALSDTGIESTNAHGRILYVLVVACLPLVVAGLLTQLVFLSGAVSRTDNVGQSSAFAYFNYPVAGDLVADQFAVSGRLEHVPEGEVVYLVEHVENRFWPKLRIGSEPTDFYRMQETSSGKGYKYTIALLSANEHAQAQISHWFARGKKTNKYPGIESIEGITELARVRVVHQ